MIQKIIQKINIIGISNKEKFLIIIVKFSPGVGSSGGAAYAGWI